MQDNAPVHVSRPTEQCINEHGVCTLKRASRSRESCGEGMGIVVKCTCMYAEGRQYSSLKELKSGII